MRIIRNHRQYSEARQVIESLTRRASEEPVDTDSAKAIAEELWAHHRIELRELVNEVSHYENAVLGKVKERWGLNEIGRLMVDLRLAKGLTEEELATRLGDVNAVDLVRDEVTEFQGFGHRLRRICDALGVKAQIVIEDSE